MKAEDLGYDPCDQNSFPYQADDPPFGPHRLTLEDVTPERAAHLDAIYEVAMTIDYDDDGPSNYRMLDMALRLFNALVHDEQNAYADIAFPDLFGACCRQAQIWERG